MDTVTIYFPNGMKKEVIENCRIICCIDGMLEVATQNTEVKKYSGFLYEITKNQNISATSKVKTLESVLNGIG